MECYHSILLNSLIIMAYTSNKSFLQFSTFYRRSKGGGFPIFAGCSWQIFTFSWFIWRCLTVSRVVFTGWLSTLSSIPGFYSINCLLYWMFCGRHGAWNGKVVIDLYSFPGLKNNFWRQKLTLGSSLHNLWNNALVN